MRTRLHAIVISTLLALPLTFALAADQPPPLEEELLAIQQSWASINYSATDSDARKAAFETLAARAAEFSRQHPGRAEPLIWEGIVLSSYAGARGGLGALGLAKQARDKLQAALRIDAGALDGSAYTSLGVLYGKVPGFPLGFGDHEKAGEYLRKALQLNPVGIDANFFYGEYLLDAHRNAEAVVFLRKALAAPARPGRQLADAGRRKEALALIGKAGAPAG